MCKISLKGQFLHFVFCFTFTCIFTYVVADRSVAGTAAQSAKLVCPYNVTRALVRYCMTVLHLVLLEDVSLSTHALNRLKALSPVQSEWS